MDSSTHSPEGIVVGDISGGVGIAIGTGAQAVVTQNSSLEADRITLAFRDIEKALTVVPEGRRRRAARNAVKNLQAEAHRGEQADETRAQKWLDFLAETAPDVWEVAIDTFTNPAKGLGTVFRKIAEKARARGKQK